MRAFVLVLMLLSSAAAEKLRIAVFGDRTGGANQAVFERMVEAAERMRPDLVINVGDNVEGYTSDLEELRAQWKQVKDTYARLSCPVYICPGNHDIWDDASEAVFREETGREPNYSFDAGEVHFTVFDNSRLEEFGQCPADQVEWLRADLAKAASARHRFVFMHKPFWYTCLEKNQEDRLHKVLRDGKTTRVFTGHFHGFCYREIDGIPYHLCGSVGGGTSQIRAKGDFYGFLWVTVDGDRVDVAILGPDGVMPHDVVTFEQREDVRRIEREAIVLPVIDLPEGATEANVSVSFAAPALGGPRGEARWDVAGTAWTVEPPAWAPAVSMGQDLEPLSASVFKLRLTDPRRPFPLPTLRMTYAYRHTMDVPVEAQLVVRRQAAAKRIETAVVLDGVLDDACWTDDARLGQFSSPNGWRADVGETVVWIARDAERLYIAARCDDNDPKRIRALCKQRDSFAMITDDVLLIGIDPTNERKWAYHVMVNAAGTIFDAKTSYPPTGQFRDPRWNAPWETKAGRTETGWTIEISVPLEALGSRADAATTWAFNVGRYCPRMKGGVAWQPAPTAHPRYFGTLVLR